ncbi:hypothetical protein [Agromyces mangrovi Wang et al. 2018]|uniref:hypothetical protein n=1 Tax=Agromyces mangrovi TaxID=1858653 RepID=UPI002573A646|nr:hypothetical protein [Agromyces mangrovi]BDZ65402.1 hypothetical protein GCM10025877_23400 [Agromyces mangrovi]
MSQRRDPVRTNPLAADPPPAASATRRRAVGALSATALAAGLLAGVTVTAPASASTADAAGKDWGFNPVTALTAETFANPPATDLPWARVNMPADADPALLQEQIEQAAAANLGGLEYGQGAYPNNEQLVAILEKANELGIKVSLSHGPTQYPEGYTVDDDHARKTLVTSRAAVAGGETFDGALPAPSASANRTTVVAVVAYACDGACDASGEVVLDPDSAIDLTATLTGTNTDGVEGGTTAGDLSWTAPEGDDWQVVVFWSRGVFNQPDPFSSEGTTSSSRAWRPPGRPRSSRSWRRTAATCSTTRTRATAGRPTSCGPTTWPRSSRHVPGTTSPRTSRASSRRSSASPMALPSGSTTT